LEGKRTSLARAITLVESSLPEHQVQAGFLLSSVLQKQKEKPSRTFRIGISGSPGVGKSTFIEALGTFLVTQAKHKVAVLAVDPSSTRTGGSVLGDKTRMEELSRLPEAYVRPSPSRGTLGGVTRTTQDAIVLCEAAGYDIVLVETVGVGQSETAVENMTDMFLLLVPPAGGDELQGIKKGIMELVDMVIINKADGELIPIAKRAMGEYKTALNLMVAKSDLWTPPIKLCSSIEKTNIAEIWREISNYWRIFEETGTLKDKRGQQRTDWMWKMVQDELTMKFEASAPVQKLLPSIQKQVELGEKKLCLVWGCSSRRCKSH